VLYIDLINYKHGKYKLFIQSTIKNKMKRIIMFGRRKFICELKKVAVRGNKKTVEKVFCKEAKKK